MQNPPQDAIHRTLERSKAIITKIPQKEKSKEKQKSQGNHQSHRDQSVQRKKLQKKNRGIRTRYSPWKCARENIGRVQPSEKDKRTSKPLFLGGPLLGSSPGSCGLRGSSLGDTARLGLSQNLGLLNDSRGLECSSVTGRSRGADGLNIRRSTYGGGGLASLARVSLGLGGGLLARSLCDSLGTSLGGGLISQLVGTIEIHPSMRAYLSRGLSRSFSRSRSFGRSLGGRLRSGLDRSILLRKLQRARWA